MKKNNQFYKPNMNLKFKIMKKLYLNYQEKKKCIEMTIELLT